MADRAFEVGDKFYIRKVGKDRLYHVRAIDDDYVIFRCWSKRWQVWRYDGEPTDIIQHSFDIGLYRGR